MKGEKIIAFGLTEPDAGSDAGSITTTAVEDGDAYILNGRKTFITMAPLADYAIIYAKTDPTKGTKGITAFIVDLKSEGVSFGKPEDKMGLIGCATSDIVLDDVRVPKSDILGELGRGFINAMKTLDGGRLGVAAQSIGVAQGCLDESIKYAKERRQFGKPIGKFQGISFMIADMAAKLAAAKELVYHAALLKDQNDKEAGTACAMAKYFASEICNEIAGKAVQTMEAMDLSRNIKWNVSTAIVVFTIYEGTSRVQQMVIASRLLKTSGLHP